MPEFLKTDDIVLPTEDAFNRALNGGGRLGEGRHEVIVKEVRVASGGKGLVLVFSDSLDQVHQETIFMRQANSNEMNFTLVKLLAALTGTPSGGLQLGSDIISSIIPPDSLGGLTVGITLKYSDYGVTVTGAEGSYTIVDAGSGKFEEKVADLVAGATYGSKSEAWDFIKAAKLRSAGNRIVGFNSVEGAVEGNVAAIQNAKGAGSTSGILDGATSTTSVLGGAVS